MRWGVLAGAAVVLLGAALRWFRIDAQSLWYDEGISAHQLTRSYAEIVRAAALDTHPPLYYWTLKAWGDTIGASELGLRSLSAVCGTLAVVLAWLLGRRLFGPLVATLAALLLAVSPLAVYYSQEVRMYAQVTALGLLAVLAYAWTWPPHQRRGRATAYVLYALAAIGTLYTQYLGAAYLVALNVHALVWWRARSAREWLAWLGANAVVALAFVPWLPTFIDQQTHALNVSPRTPLGLVQDTLMAYAGGLVHSDVHLWTGAGLVGCAVLGALLATAAAVWPWRAAGTDGAGSNAAGPCTGDGRRQVWGASLVLLVWLVPLGLVLGLGLRSGLFEVRYLVLSLPGLCLLAALGAVRLTPWPAVGFGLGLLAVVPAAQALQAHYFDPALARDDYRGLVQAIESQAEPGDAILLSAPNQVEVFGYYYHGPLPAIGLPAQRPIDPQDTLQRLETLRSEHGRVWLVQWAMNEADPKGVIATWLAGNGFWSSHAWYGTVQLALISFGAQSAATQSLDLPLDNGLRLEGYKLGSASLKAGDTLTLTLLWRGDQAPTTARWKVFTHLLDPSNKVVAQRDAEPADNLRPTTTWQRGEEVQDNYGIAVPSSLPPGLYTLEVGMYDGETRAVFAGQGDLLILGQVQVSR